MASMIERVAVTEAEAAKIMREATENARAAIAEAERKAEETAANAREKARETLRSRAEAARQEGEARMQRIRVEGATAAEASGRAARARIPDAAAYILSEVTK